MSKSRQHGHLGKPKYVNVCVPGKKTVPVEATHPAWNHKKNTYNVRNAETIQ